MEKPWDKLRVKPPEQKYPIAAGRWDTYGGAPVHLRIVYPREVRLDIDSGYPIGPRGLREIAGFCAELASQLEGN